MSNSTAAELLLGDSSQHAATAAVQLDLPAPSTTVHPSIDHLLDSITRTLHLDSLLPHSSSHHHRIALLTTFLLLLLSLALLLYHTLLRTSSRRSTVLITGPLASGKTLLFFRLLQSTPRPTHTSMQPNEATFTPSLTPSLPPLHFFDLPAHPSLSPLLPPLLPSLRGVVFVVDTEALGVGRVGAVCAQLCGLLEREELQGRRVPVLLWWNAREGEEGVVVGGVKEVKRRLEEGVERRRQMQAQGGGVGSMADLSGEVEGRGVRPVGKVGTAFVMEDSAMPITVAQGNALKGDLGAIASWLQRL